MATDSVLCATQHMLRLFVTGQVGEGGDHVDIPQATLVADCAAGPLKEFLAAPLFGPDHVAGWTSLQGDPHLSVALMPFGDTGFSIDNSYAFLVVSSTNVLRIHCDNASTLIVELKYNHSIDR